MADAEQTVDEALAQAIVKMASEAMGDVAPSSAEQYANAAKALAEAFAWVRAPGHPH